MKMSDRDFENGAYGTTDYRVSANWGNASDPVFTWNGGTRVWRPTQWQVADFQHSPQAALRKIVERDFRDSGDDLDDPKIVAEIDKILEAAE
jgi:hypothetical protein